MANEHRKPAFTLRSVRTPLPSELAARRAAEEDASSAGLAARRAAQKAKENTSSAEPAAQRAAEEDALPADPQLRAENEDDDGYDPYSDYRPPRPMFEEHPWD